MRYSFTYFLFLLPLFFVGCNIKKEQPLFELMEETGIHFTNQVEDGKKENSFLFRNFYNGGGVAIGDINNDGLADVFFTSNQGTNKLYLNKGNFKFEDISSKSGIEGKKAWSTGVVMVDINDDGYLDIYVLDAGSNIDAIRKSQLYINNKNNTFTEKAAEYNLADTGITTHVAFFDYDKDGDLDCYILNNSFLVKPYYRIYPKYYSKQMRYQNINRVSLLAVHFFVQKNVF